MSNHGNTWWVALVVRLLHVTSTRQDGGDGTATGTSTSTSTSTSARSLELLVLLPLVLVLVLVLVLPKLRYKQVLAGGLMLVVWYY
jgi:hypothetical protein